MLGFQVIVKIMMIIINVMTTKVVISNIFKYLAMLYTGYPLYMHYVIFITTLS